MLASITPLGERSRGSSWPVTVTAFTVGAVGAGAMGGALLGELGGLIPGVQSWRGPFVLAVLVAALLMEAPRLNRHLPTSRRQVNEDWLQRYRGWVYGLGFGSELGIGVVTIVTTAAVYAAAALALASAHPATGLLIGAAFGAVRAGSLLPAHGVHDPASLSALHRRLRALEPRVRWGTVGLELVALAAVVAWLT